MILSTPGFTYLTQTRQIITCDPSSTVPQMPIMCASFLGDTGSVVLSGRRPFFYVYDAISGNVSDAYQLAFAIIEHHESQHSISNSAFVVTDILLIIVFHPCCVIAFFLRYEPINVQRNNHRSRKSPVSLEEASAVSNDSPYLPMAKSLPSWVMTDTLFCWMASHDNGLET